MEFSWSLDKYDNNTVTNLLKNKKSLHLYCLWVGVGNNGLGKIIFLVRGYYIFIDLSHLQPDMYNAWRKADVCQVVQWISNDISSAEAEIFHLVLMLKHLAPRLGRYTGDNISYMYSTLIGKVTIGKRQENLSETWITTFFFHSSGKSGQVVGHALALELQHDVQSHLMDPILVNENQTSQKCALIRTLFPGAHIILTLKEFQAAP